MSADFVVFVDESFYKWFGLPTKDSNLCYGALSIPRDRIPDLVSFESGIRQFAFDQLPPREQAKRTSAEIKYSDFRHLSVEGIDILGQKLDYFLTKNRCSIFGYFIPAEGFMNYQLRSDFIDEASLLKTLPNDEYEARIEAIRQEMLQTWKDAEHNVGLLTECYQSFFNFVVQFHGRFLKKTFQIVYDSRNPLEDARLHSDAEEFAKLTERATPGVFAFYQGFKTASSSESPGIRLVDWIAGEVRSFFYRNPAVMSGASSFDILSPYWNPRMILVEGRLPFYRKELPIEAVESFERMGKGFMLPQIKKHFASGFLTYYARHGEARHISIPELIAYDMAD